MLLALGLDTINTKPWSNRATEIIIAYGMNDQLRFESAIDELQNEFIKRLPQIFVDLQAQLEKSKEEK